jgi:hypothetical protein
MSIESLASAENVPKRQCVGGRGGNWWLRAALAPLSKRLDCPRQSVSLELNWKSSSWPPFAYGNKIHAAV